MTPHIDVTKRSTALLISNLAYCVSEGLEVDLRLQIMEELDRRLPQGVDMALDAGKGEDSASVGTQNFVAPTNFADEQPLLEIEADFEDIWKILGSAIQSIKSVRLKNRLKELQDMFQNPAIIKPINWMAD